MVPGRRMLSYGPSMTIRLSPPAVTSAGIGSRSGMRSVHPSGVTWTCEVVTAVSPVTGVYRMSHVPSMSAREIAGPTATVSAGVSGVSSGGWLSQAASIKPVARTRNESVDFGTADLLTWARVSRTHAVYDPSLRRGIYFEPRTNVFPSGSLKMAEVPHDSVFGSWTNSTPRFAISLHVPTTSSAMNAAP